jgi:L-ribulose-5-phosphate 4-epimerase
MSEPIDEGYIKFDCEWVEGDAPAGAQIASLAHARDRLHALGLIGESPDGVGFGNVSARLGDREFVVTGTQTGGIASIGPQHLTVVREYDIARNWLRCVGPVKASSESLTHAAIYECSGEIRAVVHIHSLDAWNRLCGTIPTTRPDVPYGTPEMAREIGRLYRESELPTVRVAAMAGHREGIIGFGRSIEEALEAVVNANFSRAARVIPS